jgi:hypothetical protein
MVQLRPLLRRSLSITTGPPSGFDPRAIVTAPSLSSVHASTGPRVKPEGGTVGGNAAYTGRRY